MNIYELEVVKEILACNAAESCSHCFNYTNTILVQGDLKITLDNEDPIKIQVFKQIKLEEKEKFSEDARLDIPDTKVWNRSAKADVEEFVGDALLMDCQMYYDYAHELQLTGCLRITLDQGKMVPPRIISINTGTVKNETEIVKAGTLGRGGLLPSPGDFEEHTASQEGAANIFYDQVARTDIAVAEHETIGTSGRYLASSLSSRKKKKLTASRSKGKTGFRIPLTIKTAAGVSYPVKSPRNIKRAQSLTSKPSCTVTSGALHDQPSEHQSLSSDICEPENVESSRKTSKLAALIGQSVKPSCTVTSGALNVMDDQPSEHHSLSGVISEPVETSRDASNPLALKSQSLQSSCIMTSRSVSVTHDKVSGYQSLRVTFKPENAEQKQRSKDEKSKGTSGDLNVRNQQSLGQGATDISEPASARNNRESEQQIETSGEKSTVTSDDI